MRDPPISLAVLTELFGGGSVNFEWSFIEIRATVLRAKSETKGEHGPEASEAGLRSDRVFHFSEGHGSQAEHPPVGAAQFPLRSGQIEPSLRRLPVFRIVKTVRGDSG